MLVLTNISAINAQVLYDTNEAVIRKINKQIPGEFNISDVIIKTDIKNDNYVIRVDIDIPIRTNLKLLVKDTTGTTLIYLINDEYLTAGKYRIKWNMAKCKVNDCYYPKGKYICEFETEQFIYQRDFYLN
jgi:hypothetical protein